MQTKKQKPLLGISIGDINGIGPEVILKALADARVYANFTPVIYGHGKALSYYKKIANQEDLYFTKVRTLDEIQHRKVNVLNCLEECPEIIPGVETQEAGKLAFAAFATAVEDLKS